MTLYDSMHLTTQTEWYYINLHLVLKAKEHEPPVVTCMTDPQSRLALFWPPTTRAFLCVFRVCPTFPVDSTGSVIL